MSARLGARILEWTIKTFGAAGPITAKERALRLLEEAVELAQSEGVSRDVVSRIADRAFGRPPGMPLGEAAQVALTLWGYCEHHGWKPADLAQLELRRVETISAEDWTARNNSKKIAGICD